jgi:hypothetical protein
MSGETLDGKAARLLVEGRLRVVEVNPGIVRATCQGDSGRHRLEWTAERLACSCQAAQHGTDCAHGRALRLVVVSPAAEPRRLTAARLRAEQQAAARDRARLDHTPGGTQ